MLTNAFQQLGLPIFTRNLSVSFAQTRPPPQFLSLFLSDLPDIHCKVDNDLEQHIALALDKLRTANEPVARIWNLVGQKEGGPSLCLVRSDICLCHLQQSLHFAGMFL